MEELAELVPRVGWGMAYLDGTAPLWESHLCSAVLCSAMRSAQQDSPPRVCPRDDHLNPVYPSVL